MSSQPSFAMGFLSAAEAKLLISRIQARNTRNRGIGKLLSKMLPRLRTAISFSTKNIKYQAGFSRMGIKPLYGNDAKMWCVVFCVPEAVWGCGSGLLGGGYYAAKAGYSGSTRHPNLLPRCASRPSAALPGVPPARGDWPHVPGHIRRCKAVGDGHNTTGTGPRYA